jgi:hypothetical protein
MSLIEKIVLPNDLVVEVWDRSRTIAAATTRVELLIKMKLDLTPSCFDNIEQFEMIKAALGTSIFYEHRLEKPFVKHEDKDAVCEKLLESFKKISLPYFSRPAFPRRFALSRYRDIDKSKHKCSFLPS